MQDVYVSMILQVKTPGSGLVDKASCWSAVAAWTGGLIASARAGDTANADG